MTAGPGGPPRDPRHRRGLRGERAAIRFLASLGARVLAHRFLAGRNEIDVVARFPGVVAFVEVKTRRTHAMGHPLEAVHWKKRRAIARVAAAWMDRHGRPGECYRFDVVGVEEGPSGELVVTHVADAWRLDRF